MVSAYAPGEWGVQRARDSFWAKLQRVWSAFPKRAFRLGGIDANGELASGGPVAGFNSAAEASKNGEELHAVCASAELRAANTWFADEHRFTCHVQWGHVDKWRQIDYVLTDGRLPGAAVNARTVLTWPVQLQDDGGVDHLPVLLDLVGIRAVWTKKKPRMVLDPSAVQDPTKLEQAREMVSELGVKVRENVGDPDKAWELAKNGLYHIQRELFVKKAGARKPWVDGEAFELIKERAGMLKEQRLDREELQVVGEIARGDVLRERIEERKLQLRRLTKRIREQVRMGWKQWAMELGKDAMQAAEKGDFREVYRIEKVLSGRKKMPQKGVVNNDAGEMAIGAEATQLAWLQHGLGLYGGEEVTMAERKSGVLLQGEAGRVARPPTTEELEEVAKRMPKWRATKEGCVSIAVVKGFMEEAMNEVLVPLFDAMVNGSTIHIPSEARDCKLVWLHKGKLAMEERKGYRGLGIRDHIFQLFIGVYARRLQKAQQDTLDSWFYGYRAKRGRQHAIFVVRMVLWRLTAAGKDWALLLFDQEKYFDMLDREAMFQDALDMGCHEGDVEVLRATLKDSCYEHVGMDIGTRYQRTDKGVPQGGKESAQMSLGPMQRIVRRNKDKRAQRRESEELQGRDIYV